MNNAIEHFLIYVRRCNIHTNLHTLTEDTNRIERVAVIYSNACYLHNFKCIINSDHHHHFILRSAYCKIAYVNVYECEERELSLELTVSRPRHSIANHK